MEEFAALDWSSIPAAAESVQRVAVRVGRALARGLVLAPVEFGKEALDLLTLENLWTTAVILAFWIIASVIGGPFGLAVNGILIAYALWDIPKLAEELGTALKDGLVTAANATSEADLDMAAHSFATVFATVGIEVFQVFVTHRIFVFAKPRLLKKFKVPPSVEAEHKKSRDRVKEKEREKAKNDEKEKQAEKERTTTREKLAAGAEVLAAAGVQPAADSVPTAAIVAGTVVAIVGTAAAALYLTKDGK